MTNKTEKEWETSLSPKAYHVLREKGTEQAFSGKYNDHYENGIYKCIGCGNELFLSDSKFDSSCGWPSYDQAISKDAIKETLDTNHGMVRTEITCSNCGGHLGHVFEDGPLETTGRRYCINSTSLNFVKDCTKK